MSANYIMITNKNTDEISFISIDYFEACKGMFSDNSIYEYVHKSDSRIYRLGDV